MIDYKLQDCHLLLEVQGMATSTSKSRGMATSSSNGRGMAASTSKSGGAVTHPLH